MYSKLIVKSKNILFDASTYGFFLVTSIEESGKTDGTAVSNNLFLSFPNFLKSFSLKW